MNYNICLGPNGDVNEDGKPIWYCHGELCKAGTYESCKMVMKQRGYVIQKAEQDASNTDIS